MVFGRYHVFYEKLKKTQRPFQWNLPVILGENEEDLRSDVVHNYD